MSKKSKQVPQWVKGQALEKRKQVVIGSAPGSYYDRHPSWQFFRAYPEYVHGRHDFWGVPAMLEDAKMILDKLRGLDARTWREIFQDKNCREDNHMVDVAKLADEPRRYIREHEKGLERIMSFRMGSTHRLFGKVTDEGVFLALLWDREHRVYPMAYRR